MYISRDLFAAAYNHLKHYASCTNPSILILVALDTDSLCATRILTQLLKRDFLLHKIHPVAGYKDLQKANETLIKGNDDLRFLICLGMGGMVDMEESLDLKKSDGSTVECWLIDSRRPWNLHNIFGGKDGMDDNRGSLVHTGAGRKGVAGAKVGGGRWDVGNRVGGIKCFDDGDIEEEMEKEGHAFTELVGMPEVDSDDDDSSDEDEEEDEDEDEDEVAGSDVNEEGSNGLIKEAVNGNSRKRKSDDGSDRDSDSGDESERDRSRRPRMNDDESPPDTPRLHRHILISNRGSTRPLASVESSPSRRRNRDDSLLPASSRPSSPFLPPPLPSQKTLRKKLRRLRRKHTNTITKYYSRGSWYGEPIAAIMYSLASDLGREDNDLLWLAIIGVCSGEIYGRGISPSAGDLTYGAREDRIRSVMKDEVRRLNPPELVNGQVAPTTGLIQTTATSPNDTSIRISPEFRFMLIRHWSLYDSMLHSAYLGTKLRIWSENGRKKLHKLLAKMGFSLVQCRQSYTHMDMDLKRTLREKLEGVAGLYGIDEAVREGFVRSWGWKACLSATDVGIIVGSILEVGGRKTNAAISRVGPPVEDGAQIAVVGFKGLEEERLREEAEEKKEEEEWLGRFYEAYDALDDVDSLLAALPNAMTLHRAIVRTGTSLIEKRQIRLLKAFRMAVVKDGPDVHLFTHPAALTKLAIWVGEAVYEQEKDENRRHHLPIVVAALNERRGVYVLVGMGSAARIKRKKPIDKAKEEKRKLKEKAKEEKRQEKLKRKAEGDEEEDQEEEEEESSEDDDDSDDEMIIEKGYGRNRFGIAFQEVANTTNARIRIDSFEVCVVEVKKDDLPGFFESLSFKVLMG